MKIIAVDPGEQAVVTDSPSPRYELTRTGFIALITVFALGGIGGAAALVIQQARTELTDDAQIRSVLGDFADAVESGSTQQVVELLCAEEAALFSDRVSGGEEAEQGGSTGHDQRRSVDISGIVMRGDIASAQVARPPSEPRPLYLRKEDDQWKVCAPAADQFG
ncbi:Rv0361 family membrane protein [Nocardia gamkensis]|uniref:Rv0361 family membrane protein n=1 Tax=Nocardia gamkensis TaxID=352869 RepID=UPI0037CA126B